MDLIYIILSIYLRLFQTALPMSRVPNDRSGRTPKSPQQWAVWIPVVGWVSVLVRFVPHAAWLAWRVTAVERLNRPRRRPHKRGPLYQPRDPDSSEQRAPARDPSERG